MRETEIRSALADFSAKYGPKITMLATVASVNSDELTCVLDDDGIMYEDVRLRPVIDENEGLTLLPKIGTWALAIRIEDDEDWMIIGVGEVDKVRARIGSSVWEQTTDGFLVKKGTDTLKTALKLIVEAVQQVTVIQGNNPDYVKLSQAKEMINNLLQ